MAVRDANSQLEGLWEEEGFVMVVGRARQRIPSFLRIFTHAPTPFLIS